MSTQTDKILPTLQQLRDNGETDPEAALIFQALGAASVCWGKMEGTGLFDSDRAKRIGDELLFELSLTQPKEGLEAENERLRALVQAGDAMHKMLAELHYNVKRSDEDYAADIDEVMRIWKLETCDIAAKKEGFTPTNTEGK